MYLTQIHHWQQFFQKLSHARARNLNFFLWGIYKFYDREQLGKMEVIGLWTVLQRQVAKH